ncbi:MAG: PIN domain-containing protein [Candidatus Firestonebacteria bacterium]
MAILIRILFVVASAAIGSIFIQQFGYSTFKGLLFGSAGGLAVVLMEFLFKKVSVKDLVTLLAGLVLGLLMASLFSYGLSFFPALKAARFDFIPIVIYFFSLYFGISLALNKKDEILGFKLSLGGKGASGFSPKVLDTSVIIDGRVSEVLEIGFLDGEIIVPRFVLHELQLIADSPDAMKRNRGRRGLDILNKMQKMSPNVKVYDDDFPEVNGVDQKLIKLGKKYNAKIVTNDFNLNKVAEVEKVKVLNLNDLSNAVKPIVLPGEQMRVKILKEGKEAQQGVAYLDDGTMIVVDGAKNHLNQTLDIVITSVIQTSAGRMIFAKKKDD